MTARRLRSKKIFSYAPWKRSHERMVIELYPRIGAKGLLTYPECAGRSPDSIHCRAKQLGIRRVYHKKPQEFRL